MNIDELEIEELQECRLCLNLAENGGDPFRYFWRGGKRVAPVCRKCADRLLRKGEWIVGVTIRAEART
jgi:hypothetical protein